MSDALSCRRGNAVLADDALYSTCSATICQERGDLGIDEVRLVAMNVVTGACQSQHPLVRPQLPKARSDRSLKRKGVLVA